MKYLKHFESYSEDVKPSDLLDVKPSDLSNEQTRELHKKSLEYLLDLSDSEKIKLKSDLEKFAADNGLTLDQLENPETVKKLLESNINEGLGSWLKENWYSLVSKISKYGSIAALLTFLGSMSLSWIGGFETLLGIKVAAAAWVVSSIVGALKGLK